MASSRFSWGVALTFLLLNVVPSDSPRLSVWFQEREFGMKLWIMKNRFCVLFISFFYPATKLFSRRSKACNVGRRWVEALATVIHNRRRVLWGISSTQRSGGWNWCYLYSFLTIAEFFASPQWGCNEWGGEKTVRGWRVGYKTVIIEKKIEKRREETENREIKIDLRKRSSKVFTDWSFFLGSWKVRWNTYICMVHPLCSMQMSPETPWAVGVRRLCGWKPPSRVAAKVRIPDKAD